ncbi:hypothetical protein, partial [Streptomyces kanamyceticus]
MAMVGLFWIAEGDVYVGAKPAGLAPGVRLSPEGVTALGDKQSAFWLWDDIHELTVENVPVKSLKLHLGTMVDMALTLGLGGDDEAPTVTVRMRMRTGTADAEVDADADAYVELTAYTAAASGYSQTEYDLSRALLSRMTEGAATLHTTLAEMARWGR